MERLGSSDAGEILTLQRAAYVTEAQAHRDPWLPPLTQSLDDLLAELARPRVHAWGLREDRRLVAAVRAEVDGDVARLGRLVVAPDRQGHGWGTRLLLAAERELTGTVAAIELFTDEYSAANLRLYRRAGYTETGRSPAGGYDLVHLRKNLGDPPAGVRSPLGSTPRRRVSSGSPYEAGIGFSRALRSGNRVLVSGTGPAWADGSCAPDATTQARRCFEIINEALATAGAGPADVVRTRMFVTDPAVAEDVGAVHREVLGDARPAATMVVVAALLDPRWKVEIEAEAEVTDDDGFSKG